MDWRVGLIAWLVIVLVAFGWITTAAPSLVSFAAAVAIGAGWCRWLETHPEARP